MKVKVCGITRREDAEMAVRLGAWAVGFIFAPESPRRISPQKAAAIIPSLPNTVEKVGVFVNASVEEMRIIETQTGITMFQLHGEETEETVKALTPRVIKAVPLQQAEHLWSVDTFAKLAWAVLVDARKGEQRGGTGEKADWALAAAAVESGHRILLAGGITPENVQEAVLQVKPFAVDISSGLESSPGVKDASKMEKFFAIARKL